MIYTPTNSELTKLAKLLNLPTIPRKSFLSALIDVYTDFCDMDYNEIVRDINAEYLTYHSEKPVDVEVECPDSSEYGYLWYYDGGYESCVAIN